MSISCCMLVGLRCGHLYNFIMALAWQRNSMLLKKSYMLESVDVRYTPGVVFIIYPAALV